MTPGHRSSSESTHLSNRSRRWAPAVLLAATALMAACGSSSSSSGDTTPPTVVITDSVPGATATGNVTFNFTFSEDVGTSFTAASVTVTGGTKGAFTKSSATFYTLVVVPTAATAGTITVSLAPGAFTDLAGNGNTAVASASQAYDTRPVSLTQMDLPVNFDSATVNYGLLGFAGADDSSIVADPTNAANKVAKVNRSATADTFAGTTITADPTPGFATKIPFDAANTRMTVRTWSPDAGIQVRLKVEDHTNPGISVETEATTTVAGAWETLTFDFASQAAGTAAIVVTNTYDKATIFFNFGVTGATAGAKTYYFDDVIFIGGGGTGGGGGGAFATVTFDSATTNYVLTGFGGAEDSTKVADPTNAANQVAKVNRSATAETFAGTTISTGANNTVGKIPFDAANTRMTVRTWSPDAGIQVRLKVEDHTNAGISVETEATTTVAGAWETLTFDFASQAAGTAAIVVTNTYDRATIFFNFGVNGATAGAKTYYCDDLTFIGGGGTGGGGGGAFATVTFDSATTNYVLTGFGGADDSTVVADPTNAANQVAKVVKSATAELWAGTTVITGANNSVGKMPFDAANTRMTVRVWSPDAGIPVRLKVEDAADPTHSCETEAVTTVASTWETLTFDFATQAAGTAALNFAFNYDKASIFFNFGTTGAVAGAKTYYFDDVTFIGGTAGGGGGGSFATVTFDDAAVTYTLTGFGGAEDSSVVVDPTDAANKVGRTLKSGTAELWAGVTVSTAANNMLARIPLAAGKTRMTLRVWSPDAGIPVRLKVEDAADPTHSCETEATVTVASGWQTLTFDFANQAAGTAALNVAYTFNRASVFFNFGTTGAVAGAKTYYYDDLAFVP